MTELGVISGFLGAGKTTLLKKLIRECFSDKKVCVIENEMGEIHLHESDFQAGNVQVKQLAAGCICCTLVQELRDMIQEIMDTMQPDYILLEPAGASDLAAVCTALERINQKEVRMGFAVTVVDGTVCSVFIEEFGAFYKNQIRYADAILVSHTQECNGQELEACQKDIAQLADQVPIWCSSWEEIDGTEILSAAVCRRQRHGAKVTGSLPAAKIAFPKAGKIPAPETIVPNFFR